MIRPGSKSPRSYPGFYFKQTAPKQKNFPSTVRSPVNKYTNAEVAPRCAGL